MTAKTTKTTTPPTGLEAVPVDELRALARQGHKTAAMLLELEALAGHRPPATAGGVTTGDQTGDDL